MNEQLKLLVDNQKDFLRFLKAKYHLYHLSNVFFRDMHYGVMAYLELNNMKHKYAPSEELTRKVVESLEQAKILKNVGHLAWVLTYPEFKKPSVKPAPPARPAVPAAKPASAQAPKPVAPAASAVVSSDAAKS
ncbi:MAG TPA: hypothetical protein VI704_07760 [Bacteroidota bacterium]|nr:hypothetical protein [Bacteroidota bacterium]